MANTLAATTSAGATNTLRGVAFMVAAMIIFAAQDGLSKALADNHSAIFVTMWRYWAFGGVCLVLLWRKGFRAGLTSGQPRLQMLRGVLLALEICVAIAAFALLGLAPSHAIFAFMPLLVVALSGPVLGEKVGWRRWSAVGVGLIGMMLIIRPGTRALTPELGVAILGMFMFAAYQLMTRRVARTDAAMTSFYYTGVFGAVTMTLIGPWFWSSMSGLEMAMLAVLCVTGMSGHFLLIKAFEAAEASAIQPFSYLQTVMASAIGVVIFGEVMSAWTVLGGAIIIGAGLFAFWRERVRAKASGHPTVGT
ncbi:DMT family transporter [Acuticoccus sp. I52.16.1]|uniref:DMT family transporter n=1 Tax=Acuticoccus sp. I52.16.1 TaxID=2928472 RepID=UPI001FD4D188|nr:DMT family transporter [Acuticoccus sp. I52.16.1]UOM34789.1 DMT family transporter [Acuticoccus sp. I52.16.1]